MQVATGCLCFGLSAPGRVVFDQNSALCATRRKTRIWRKRGRVRCARGTSRRHDRAELARKLSVQLTDYSRAGDAEGMARTTSEFREAGLWMNGVNYTTVAKGLVRAGRPWACFNVLAAMRDAKLCPSQVTLRVAADACMQWSDRRCAATALDKMIEWWCSCDELESADDSSGAEAWYLVLHVYAHLGDTRRLRRAVELMRSPSRPSRVPVANARAFNVLLAALPGIGAVALFGAMLCGRPRVAPDVITYNTLLRHALRDRALGVALCSRFEGASPTDDVILASLLFARAVQRSMRINGVVADATTWTALVRLVGRARAEGQRTEAMMQAMLREYWSSIRRENDTLDLIVRFSTPALLDATLTSPREALQRPNFRVCASK